MPIYHDYHGDSKSSSISTWDQIQIGLKSLLPSYEPILYDSSIVSSFLNYQKQPLSFLEFQQSCDSINATLRKLMQEEEENLYPESQAQLQQDLDPEIQAQIQSNKIRCTEIEKPDPEFAKSKYTKTDSSIDNSVQESDQQIQAKSELKFLRINNYSTNEEEWNSAIVQNLTEVNTDPTFNKSTKPQLNSIIQIRSQFQNQVDEDESDVSSNYQGVFDRSATVVVDRPPPEPPDLGAFEVGKDEPASALITTEAGSCRPDDLIDPVTGIHRGAEDSAVTKGRGEGDVAKPNGSSVVIEDEDDKPNAEVGLTTTVEDIDARLETESNKTTGMPEFGSDDKATDLSGDGYADNVNNEALHNAEVVASVRGKWTFPSAAEGRVAWRNGRAPFCCARLLVAKPPPLLAAVLPWDREGARSEEAVRMAGSGEALRRRVPFSTEPGGGAPDLRPIAKGEAAIHLFYLFRDAEEMMFLSLPEVTPQRVADSGMKTEEAAIESLLI
ncbi:hypothetical protein PIB30_001979 [Stylosanthes scabra]|uniref:Uncharacterized protein n=1 Tax=Stylosanthes scabra TaxID=79078 RepID=A0ABU6Z2P1_9FABA|nr:hypothetical protein [Stylosanthes scabra]